MKPAIAVQAIFTFVGSWNNYFTPALIIQSKNKMIVPILIATLRGADYMNFDMGKIYMMITVAIVPIIVVYLLLSKYIIDCRCHTWRREGVNNLISFSIRADGLHICYVGHLFFSILKYEVRHIFYLGNIVAPMQYISKRMQQNLQNISSQISCRIMIILSKQENSTITMQCI